MNHSKEIKDVFPKLPERIIGLGELSYNLWWSWHPAARMLFKMIDRPAWKESIHNPVRMLREVPRGILESAANNPDFLQHYDAVLTRFHNELEAKSCWFTDNMAETKCLPIAYFSAEYGLHRSLPFYAGGYMYITIKP